MFNWLKEKLQSATETQVPTAPEVLGLRLGGVVELNELRLRMINDQLITDNIAKMQMIQAVGVVNLDAGHSLLRYYTDDDAYIQIVLEGGLNDEHITDVKLFHYYESKGVNSEASWNQLLNAGVSSPTFRCEDKTFNRVWDSMGSNPPVAMTETTYTQGAPTTETDQFTMLYELALAGDLYEFLFVSAEEKIIDNQYDRSLIISSGINLSQADFEVAS